MGWHVLDAVGKAFERTRKCLIEPFNFWKWLKLTIIVLLAGGGANFGNSGFNVSDTNGDISNIQIGEMGSIGHAFDQISSFLNLNLIIAGIILLVLFLIILWYISNVMQFVFVDSIVKNDVKFWESSRKYLGMGFNLFIIRVILFLIFFSLIVIAALPLILQIINEPSENFLQTMFADLILIMSVILVVGITSAIIDSFINLCIPLAIYQKTGIIAAFKKVLRNFKADWEQIIVYWVGRIILWIGGGIAVSIVLLLVVIILGVILLLIDTALYFILSALLSGYQDLIWIILAPIAFIQVIVAAVIILMGSMPLDVFMKYHAITFLERWYPNAGIPFFDIEEINEETGIIEDL